MVNKDGGVRRIKSTIFLILSVWLSFSNIAFAGNGFIENNAMTDGNTGTYISISPWGKVELTLDSPKVLSEIRILQKFYGSIGQSSTTVIFYYYDNVQVSLSSITQNLNTYPREFTCSVNYNGPINKIMIQCSSNSNDLWVYEVNYTAYTDNIPPSVPTNLTANPLSGDMVFLTWNAVSDPDLYGYYIYRDGVKVKEIDNSTITYTDTGLNEKTTYQYQISAVDKAGNESSKSEFVSVTTPDTTPPEIPSNFQAVPINWDAVLLTWNAVNDQDISKYFLYRDGIKIKEIDKSITNYIDTGLNEKTSYEYQLSSVDTSENESEKTPIVSVTTPAMPDTTPPKTPINLHLVSKSSWYIKISWDPVEDTDINKYIIYRNSNRIAEILVDKNKEVSNISYTDIGVQPQKEYIYQVSAVDNSGNESDLSEEVTVKTPLGITLPISAAGDIIRQVGLICGNFGSLIALALTLKVSPFLISIIKRYIL